MVFSSAFRRLVNGSLSLKASTISNSQIRSKHSVSRAQKISSERPIRQFVSSKGKSAGRNSAGRITIFHRGGGAKQLQRKIDLKRSTSSLGFVERIEYDPNRTSRIAVVRWVEGAGLGQHKKVNTVEELAPPHKILQPTMTSIKGQFSFSSLPGMEEKRKVVCPKPMANHVVIGLPNLTFPGSKTPFTSNAERSKITSPKDVFFSALSSSKTKGYKASYSFVHSLGLPRIAIAGAKPDFFAPKLKNEVEGNESLSLGEIRKWDKDSAVWANKIKRKAAVSWQSFRRQETLGLVGVNEHNEMKQKLKAKDEGKRDGKYKVDRAPVTYIIASHKMEPGKMVMNCDISKRFDALSAPGQNSRRV